MRRSIPFALALFLTSIALKAEQVTSHGSTQPAAAAGPEAELVSLTNAWTDAILAKDRVRLDALMAPDFALYGWGDGSRSVPRALWLENLFQHLRIAEYEHSAIVARVYGDVAMITSKYYWRGSFLEKPFENHGYVVDVWRRGNGRWQVVSRTSVGLPGREQPVAPAAPTKTP
jgi:hypothetical protein